MSGLALRPYQEDALQALHDGYNAGDQRLLTVMPTGAGKTVVFAHLIRDLSARTLVVAHREELIRQTVEKITMVDRGANVGVVKAHENHYWADIVVASIQTIQREHRLSQLGSFGLIVTDEAHHATARTWTEAIERLGGFSAGGPKVSGWTATPDRTDKVGLGHVFQRVAHETGLYDLIEQGYLVDPRPVQVLIDTLDLSEVKTTAGDLTASGVGAALEAADAPEHVAQALNEYAPDRKALVFMPTVKTANATAEAILATGRPAGVISEKTDSRTRARHLADIQTGRITALVNCMVLTEGTDLPAVDCIVVGRPTKSRSLYQQMIGRGLRLYPGKEDCLVLDVAGDPGRHKLATVADLFGLDPKALAGKTVTEAKAEQQALAEQRAVAMGRLVAVTSAGVMRRAHWVPSHDGRFVLTVANGLIVLAHDDRRPGTWTVDVQRPIYDGGALHLSDGLSLEYAQGLAEDYARKAGAAVLIDPEAPWRSRPVTEKQAYMLKRYKLRPENYRTAGEASDAISAAKAGGYG